MGWGEHDEPARSEHEVRLERALRLARKILSTDQSMVKDALVVIDNALETP